MVRFVLVTYDLENTHHASCVSNSLKFINKMWLKYVSLEPEINFFFLVICLSTLPSTLTPTDIYNYCTSFKNVFEKKNCCVPLMILVYFIYFCDQCWNELLFNTCAMLYLYPTCWLFTILLYLCYTQTVIIIILHWWKSDIMYILICLNA